MLRRRLSMILAVMMLISLTTFIDLDAAGIRPGYMARVHMTKLSENIGPRVAGTEGERLASDYIKTALKSYGYAIQAQDFKYSTKRNGVSEIINSQNIIAIKPGISSKEIIVGAHYDSVDAGKGADDNASGVGVLLELAEQLKNIETPYTVKFIAFGAEEDWFKGSRHYVDEMTAVDKANVANMICIDSVAVGDYVYVYGDYGDEGVIRDFALNTADKLGLELRTQMGTKQYPAGTTGEFSDFAPFRSEGIPYTSFEATNWDLGAKDGYTQVSEEYGVNGEIWHTRFDNIKYIDKTFPGRCDSHLYTMVTVMKEILTKFNN